MEDFNNISAHFDTLHLNSDDEFNESNILFDEDDDSNTLLNTLQN